MTARTYTNTYFTDSEHTSRYVRNRVLTTKLASGGQETKEGVMSARLPAETS